MNEVLFKIILELIIVLGIILTGVLIPYIEEKIGSERLIKYKEWTKFAVQCAEMLFKEQGVGKIKKEYVISFLNDMFNKKKVVITPEQIEVLIESCVKEMKLNEDK